jgi:two-component system, cell cycle sensor histidine kinase and response regulator CckA
MTLVSSAQSNDPLVAPKSVKEWRQMALDWVLRGVLVFWLLAFLGTMAVIFLPSLPVTVPVVWTVLAVTYCVMLLATTALVLLPRLGYRVRATVFLLLLYVVGLLELLFQGDSGDGRAFLLAFVALSAVFFDMRRSVWALLLSVGTLLLVGLLQLMGVLTAVSLFAQIAIPEPVTWMNGALAFVALGVILALSITFLIRSLETSLKQSQREKDFATAVLEKTGALIVLYDVNGRILRFNHACEILTGYFSEELIGKYVWDYLLTPDGADLVKTAFSQVAADPQPISYESYWLSKNGARSLIAWYSAPLIAEDGTVESIISTGIDVTTFKETEADRSRLHGAEYEQRLLAETLAEVTLTLTSQIQTEAVLDNILRQVQRVVPFKAAHIALLEDETLRVVRWQGYEKFGSPDAIANLIQLVPTLPLESKVIQTGEPAMVIDTHQEPRWQVFPETSWVRSHLCVPILQQERVLGLLRLDGDQPGEFSQDDARRLQNLANTVAISLSNARLVQETQQKAQQVERILNTVQDGIILLDKNGRVELANPAAQSYLPLLANTSPGAPIKSLAGVPIKKVLQPPPEGALWHELSLQKSQKMFEVVGKSIETESGGWVLVVRDVSEARKQQQYLQAQERLAMIGQMAAGIAHDFNNIMTIIILYVQLMLKAPELAPDVAHRLQTVLEQSKLAANLIAQILDFSRQSDMKRRPVQMLPFLKELSKLLKRTLPENINLRFNFDEGEYVVYADLTRLQQMVMNLVVNARDAMPDGGLLSMELSQIKIAEESALPLPDMTTGDWIELRVIDNGMGIERQNLTRIFEPLFTTKDRGKGTGLGLAQVYGIVKQHNGYINVASVLGEGTTFTIYLPAQKVGDIVSPEGEDIALLGGHGEQILVVEDDQITREAICAILETYDYRTTEASSAEEARRLFEFYGDDIALVISDMVMPGMNGDVLLTHLQDKRPDIRMIVITGYPFAEMDSLVRKEGIVNWIAKPFAVEELVAAIQAALPTS